MNLCPASVLQMQDRTKQFTEDALKPGADRMAAEAEPTAKKATGQLKAGADKVAQEAGEALHGTQAAGLLSAPCLGVRQSCTGLCRHARTICVAFLHNKGFVRCDCPAP